MSVFGYIGIVILSGFLMRGTNVSAVNFGVYTPADPILEISLSASQLNLNLMPKADTTSFGTANLTATAGTNNLTGYTLYMQVENPNLTRTEPLINNTTPTIPSLTERLEGYTEENFTRNHWGYKLSNNSNYFAIPNNVVLSSSLEPTNGVPTTVTFASKIDMTLPAGSYTADIDFVAVSNAPSPTLQDINTWRGSLSTGQTIKAQDTRDGKYYLVGKLADGNIWLLDNLAIDLTDSSVQTKLTAATTNATATSINALINGGRASGNQYATAGVSSSWSNSYSVPIMNLASENTVPSNPPAGGYGNNRVGGYYNYCAATAGSYCYGENDSYGTPSGDATEDICPAGWMMPTVEHYSDNSLAATLRSDLSSPFSGYFVNSASYDQGARNFSWSSTAGNGQNAYNLKVDTNNIYPDDMNPRYYGFSVRCVAKSISSKVPTNAFDKAFAAAGKSKVSVGKTQYYKMQDMTSSICSAVDNSKADEYTQVVDIRDNNIYNIGKLKDNRCWMLDNLALNIDEATVKNNLSNDTTNASDTSLGYLKNGGGTASDKYAISKVANWNSGSSNSTPLVNVAHKDTVPNGAPKNGHGDNKVGGFYNFCAASAGSYCYGEGSSSSGSPSGNATEDICPKGWKIPSGNKGEYQTLATAITGTSGSFNDATQVSNFVDALSLPRSGYFYNSSSPYDQGSYGNFWSSTKRSGGSMYRLRINASTVNPADSDGRKYGLSIRCINVK